MWTGITGCGLGGLGRSVEMGGLSNCEMSIATCPCVFSSFVVTAPALLVSVEEPLVPALRSSPLGVILLSIWGIVASEIIGGVTLLWVGETWKGSVFVRIFALDGIRYWNWNCVMAEEEEKEMGPSGGLGISNGDWGDSSFDSLNLPRGSSSSPALSQSPSLDSEPVSCPSLPGVSALLSLLYMPRLLLCDWSQVVATNSLPWGFNIGILSVVVCRSKVEEWVPVLCSSLSESDMSTLEYGILEVERPWTGVCSVEGLWFGFLWALHVELERETAFRGVPVSESPLLSVIPFLKLLAEPFDPCLRWDLKLWLDPFDPVLRCVSLKLCKSSVTPGEKLPPGVSGLSWFSEFSSSSAGFSSCWVSALMNGKMGSDESLEGGGWGGEREVRGGRDFFRVSRSVLPTRVRNPEPTEKNMGRTHLTGTSNLRSSISYVSRPAEWPKLIPNILVPHHNMCKGC